MASQLPRNVHDLKNKLPRRVTQNSTFDLLIYAGDHGRPYRNTENRADFILNILFDGRPWETTREYREFRRLFFFTFFHGRPRETSGDHSGNTGQNPLPHVFWPGDHGGHSGNTGQNPLPYVFWPGDHGRPREYRETRTL